MPIQNYPTVNFKDSTGVDIGSKYITKDYILTWYPDLVPSLISSQLWTWGANFYGGAGDNTATVKSSPVTTAGGKTNWKEISCGYHHMMGIKTDGTLWGWGYNGYGGEIGDGTVASKSSPVTTAAGGTDWRHIVAGRQNSIAIKNDGSMWSWGGNDFGQLGDSTTTSRSSPISINVGYNWAMVDSGSKWQGGVKTDGTLWTWGRNNYGQLGDGTTTDRSSPGTTAGGGTNWKQISCGYFYSGGIKTDGTLWLWGLNTDGQLGDGTTTNRSSPVSISGGGTTWKQLACGYRHTAALKTDGTLWVWGSGSDGRTGTGDTVSRSSPVTIFGGGTNWKTCDVSVATTVGLKTDGTIWTCGYNTYGTLGDNSTASKSSMVSIGANGFTWRHVSTWGLLVAALSEVKGI